MVWKKLLGKNNLHLQTRGTRDNVLPSPYLTFILRFIEIVYSFRESIEDFTGQTREWEHPVNQYFQMFITSHMACYKSIDIDKI